MSVCFHLWKQNSSAYTSSLFRSHINFGYLHGSLTPTQKFRISPRVSYTHTEILDNSTGLLHLHRNFGFLHGSLTPSQKFGTSPRVSYTHIEIWDISPGLLHPHKNLRSFPGLLHPYRNSGSLLGSLTPILQASHLRGLMTPFLFCPTHFNYSSFPVSNYESSLDIVLKIKLTYTHQEW